MKKCIMVGMILKGWTVSIEKGKNYYCVVTQSFGYYECKGAIKTLAEAKKYYRNQIMEIRGE